MWASRFALIQFSGISLGVDVLAMTSTYWLSCWIAGSQVRIDQAPLSSVLPRSGGGLTSPIGHVDTVLHIWLIGHRPTYMDVAIFLNYLYP